MISLTDLQPGVPQPSSYTTYTQPIIAPPPPPTVPELDVPPRQHNVQGRNKEEAYIQMLCQDPSFVNAVQSGDTHTAARCSWKFYQHHVVSLLRSVQEEREQGAQYQRDLEYYQGPHRPHKGRYREDEDRQRDLRVGDWVVIQDVKQRTRDGDLVGQHAQVQSLDATGQWVELTVPKLGCTARIQTRFLAPLSMSVAAPRTSSGYPSSGAEPHSLLLAGQARHREGGVRKPAVSAGDASPDTDDTTSLRISRRHHFEGYVRPVTLGQPLPPAKVPSLLGRGVSKARDVCRHVRREMLSLEEVVPWECVEHSWKVRRGAWRKGLKHLDANKPIEALVTSVATALLELHLALLTDKNNAHNSLTGVLVKGGAWDARLQELVAGGNNYQCLQAIWDELHEAVRAWLHYQGQALPPPSHAPHLGSVHHTPSHPLLTSPGPPMPPPPSSYTPAAPPAPLVRTFGKASFTAVLQSINLLLSGTPVTSSELSIGQVAADRVITLGREAAIGLRNVVVQGEEGSSMGQTMETVAGACELAALFNVTQSELDRMSDADVLCLLLMTHALRPDLKYVKNIDSEAETDADVAGDMTDMELSD